MKQVFLSGDGQVEVLDAPVPVRLSGSVLVRNAFSLISSGTEGAAVTRRGGLMGTYEKAMQSRHRIELVWQMAKTQGVSRTLEQVRGKLADFTPLGYSAAGVVVETDRAGSGPAVGQRLAYMGTGLANHAQYGVATPLLSAPVPAHVALDQAAFAALASIAMQGIRRAELTPGERLLVVGLGLIGQLTLRLGQAMGYQVFGTDLDPHRIALANASGAVAWGPEDSDPLRHTRRVGFDAAVICAGSKESALVNAIFDLLRPRGRVSVVGDVGLDLDRARMYRKELELRLSCSYGPGRYDPDYELAGQDYPLAHARWTEGRNLEYFIDLLAQGRLDLSDLVNVVHPIEQAKAAFKAVKSADPKVFGILLDHGLPDDPQPPGTDSRQMQLAAPARVTPGEGPVRLGLIGVGGYAKGMHLPNLVKLGADKVQLSWLSARSNIAGAAKRFNPGAITSDYRQVLDDPDTEAVLISVRHAAHARILTEALEAGKHVYIEKPMTRTVAEARAVVEAADRAGSVVRVGFNRRFSPDMGALRGVLGDKGPAQFLARCNTGSLGGDWSNAAEEGGRFLGEGTHFLDLAQWMMDGPPRAISASVAGPDSLETASLSVTLDFGAGRVAQILYSALGHKSMGKEYYEAFGQGTSGTCRDFTETKLYGRKQASRDAVGKGDKGQLAALDEFLARVRGRDHPVMGADAKAGLWATWMAWAARESAREGRVIEGLATLTAEDG